MNKVSEQIGLDLAEAMKAGDKTRVSTLRMLKAALTNAQIAEKGSLSDQAVTAVLQKELKQRKESSELYREAGEEQRAETEEAEAEVIKTYLPQPLSESELNELIKEGIASTGAQSPAQMGMVMGWLKEKVAGRADGATIAAKVKQALGENEAA